MNSRVRPSSEIREAFLSYFEDRGHKCVPSSSLIPEDDPSLLFINAGMNQFKDVFLGMEKREYKRAVSSQKCIRVSGKHNDLETVGRTARHHTFFEMLGNFSFGDYFKKEAIEFAWELCTQVYGLASDQLYVTIYHTDTEAFRLWNSRMGIPESKIFKLGNEDNFWAMGKTGPCGPCSELHYDLGASPWGHRNCRIGCDCGRYVEIWNLVFMQYSRDVTGKITPLPTPSIDTGMGLERITSIIQGAQSNYDTDLFQPLLDEAARLMGVVYGRDDTKDVSLRILADHCRACAFLIADGLIPGNEGRGYVLRKILRRAIRHGRTLGEKRPFLHTLTALAAESMKEVYPELERSREFSATVVKNEEEKFNLTLHQGMERLNEICEDTTKRGQRVLSGSAIFRLYDTYGFPLDLAREVARENRLTIDEKGFQAELTKQRHKAKTSWKGLARAVKPGYQKLVEQGKATEFTGYSQISKVEAQILAILKEQQLVDTLDRKQSGEVILDRSPFYAEAGGQVADRGVLEGNGTQAEVEDVYTPTSDLRVHQVKVLDGSLNVGQRVQCTVFSEERISTARNHTATHLLHAALREVLGQHVKQAGSLVASDRLRFDFNHYRPLTPEETVELEKIINAKIRENLPVKVKVRDLDDAVAEGAMALFGEKYQQRVRVVRIPGFSLELCGGTHVSHSGEIGLFKIASETGISAGVRRVEAITGEKALSHFIEDERLLYQLSEGLQVGRDQLLRAVEKKLRELKDAYKEIEQLKLKFAQKESQNAFKEGRSVKGVRVLSQQVKDLDRNGLRKLADQFKNKLGSGVVVLGMPRDGKVSLVAMVSADLTNKIQAHNLIDQIAPFVGGNGGGKPEMAEAGGKDPSRLEEALEQTYRLVKESLS